MPPRRFLPFALIVATLVMGGCKDQREPAKPIVDLSAVTVSA